MIELHYGPAMLGAVLNTLNTRLDAQTLATQRLDAQPGTMYLVRPDQHVCARWRQPQEAAVRAALAQAIAAVAAPH